MKTEDLMNDIVTRAEANMVQNPSDFESGGVLVCGECGYQKQAWVEWPGDDGEMIHRLVPVMCRCDEERYRKEQEQKKRDKFLDSLKRNRDMIGWNRSFISHTFAKDDSPTSPISRACRRYVEHWDEMLEHGMGILLYGNGGTGKSFYASCIANALAEKQVLTGFTTTADLMSILHESWDKQEIMDALCRFRLLVLDDLGAERDTSYGSEMIYNVVNSRYRTGRPTIITTNLDIGDMRQEKDIWRSRIYDRVVEMCPIKIDMVGESRREKISTEKRDLARTILKGGKANGD